MEELPKPIKRFKKTKNFLATTAFIGGIYTAGVLSAFLADKTGIIDRTPFLGNAIHGPAIPIEELIYEDFEREQAKEDLKKIEMVAVCTTLMDLAYMSGPPSSLIPVDNDNNGIPESYMGVNPMGGIARFYLEPDGETYKFRIDLDYLKGLSLQNKNPLASPGAGPEQILPYGLLPQDKSLFPMPNEGQSGNF